MTTPSPPDDDTLTYEELYAAAYSQGEIIITIAASDEERTRIGLKNYKARMNNSLADRGKPQDISKLGFSSVPSKLISGCVDLTITVSIRSAVKIKALRVPENDFPE